MHLNYSKKYSTKVTAYLNIKMVKIMSPNIVVVISQQLIDDMTQKLNSFEHNNKSSLFLPGAKHMPAFKRSDLVIILTA